MTYKRIDRLKNQLAECKRKHIELTRMGRYADAQKAYAKMLDVKAEVEECENGELKHLGEVVPYSELRNLGVPYKITEAIIAIQYVQDCLIDLATIYKSLKLVDHTLVPKLREIYKMCDKVLSIVDNDELRGVANYLIENDKMLDEMHALVRSDMKEKLRLIDPNNS